jgi:hypothetical protein
MLEPGFGGTWDSYELGPMAVVHYDNQFHMWYTGWNYADYVQIGYATSPNGIDWTKDSVVLDHGESGKWDDAAVAMPYVIVAPEDTLYKMWYGGSNAIIFQTGYATSGIAVSVEKENEVLSEGFVLYQNYPNPFNPTTKLSFVVGHSSLVTLIVYDVLGNKVATLVNEYKPAGTYIVEFNPVSSIQYQASGVYFYQLKSGSFIQTKKMILLK